MPRQATVTVYEYNELNDKARKRVVNWLDEIGYFTTPDDASKTLLALSDAFPGFQVTDFDCSNGRAYCSFERDPDDYEDGEALAIWESAWRKSKYPPEEDTDEARAESCSWTGIWSDAVASETLSAPPKDAQDLHDMLKEAVRLVAEYAEEAYGGERSHECVSKSCNASGFVFFANGDPAHHLLDDVESES